MKGKKKRKTPKLDIGYILNIILVIIFLILFCILGIAFMYESFEVEDLENIRYQEKSSVDYKVYGIENLLYEKNDLEELPPYSSEDIQKMSISFDYLFKVNKKGSIKFHYQVLGDIVILDKKSKEVLRKETKEITGDYIGRIDYSRRYEIKQDIEIPYEEYNEIAKKYIKKEKKETTAYLEIYLDVKKESTEENDYHLEEESKSSIRIPLSSTSVKIKEQNLNHEKSIKKKPSIRLKNPIYFGIGVLFGVFAIIIMTYTTQKTYDKVENKKEEINKR